MSAVLRTVDAIVDPGQQACLSASQDGSSSQSTAHPVLRLLRDQLPKMATDEVRRCVALGCAEIDARQPVGAPPRPPNVERTCGMVGASQSMTGVLDLIGRYAPQPYSVLITGETGTGKELVAGALHEKSGRVGRFVTVNCATLRGDLMESELYGHVKGAFTGAGSRCDGLVSEANGGTLLLDEIGELGQEDQARLLRFLETQEFRRVGSTRTEQVDVRIVAATNRDLAAMVSQGAFRHDLYQRLNVLRIHLDPLRDRPDDVPPLVAALSPRVPDGAPVTYTDGAVEALGGHTWPGNVRELRSVLIRVAVMTEGSTVTRSDVDRALALALETVPSPMTMPTRIAGSVAGAPAAHSWWPWPSQADRDRLWLQRIWDAARGFCGRRVNESQVARDVGLHRSTLRSLLQRHGLTTWKLAELPAPA